jgi:hypothetical protein
MRGLRGVWVLGLMLACGGPKDPASAIAAGDWALVKKFLLDPNPTVRATAVAEIAKAQGAEASKLLSEAVLDSPNADVYKAALPIMLDRAIAGDKDAVSTYQKALKSTQQEVQIDSIKSLQQKGGSAAKLFIGDFKELLSDPDEPVIAAVTDAIKTLGDDGWPVVKAALTDPLPSMRTKGAQVADSLDDLTKKHLDDVANQFVAEDDGEVSPLMLKILTDSGPAALEPLVMALSTVSNASKRANFINYLGDGIAYKIEVDPKAPPPKDPKSPKKTTTTFFCPEIASAVEALIVAGSKEEGGVRDEPASILARCSGGKDNAGKPEATKIQAALEATAKDAAADSKKRGFALYVLCAPIGPGMTPAAKTWFKGAQKAETDVKVKDMYKKEGSGCK